MTFALTHWSLRRLLAVCGAGLLIEAALLASMFVFLVRPEPPLVARLRGNASTNAQIVELRVRDPSIATITASTTHREMIVSPPVREDSFYTVLHWPLTTPLLAGGGHVLAVPMRFWWVPVLYVGAVPLMVVSLTAAWLLARRH